MSLDLLEQLKQQAQERVDAGFDFVDAHYGSLYGCPTCFAIVKDWRAHKEWHEHLRKAVDEGKMLDH